MNLRPPTVLAFVKTIGKAGLIQLPDELIVNEVFRLDRFALGQVDGFSTVAIPGSVGYCFLGSLFSGMYRSWVYP